MKLLGRRNNDGENDEAGPTPDDGQATGGPAGGTAPKGRPTPKRDQGRRGPVAPAPMSTSEARARRKAMAGPKLSREERKVERNERRARTNERRARMMSGEEAYLLPRDQGPIKRYVRDIVDSRRNLLGLFMPVTLGLIFIMLAVPQVQIYISPAMLVVMALMAIDGILLGRKVGNMVDVKFPSNTESRMKLGLYASGRASQLRRMRAPRPQVDRGAEIS